MELNYKMQGDYLLPELEIPKAPELGKYGLMRRTFLKENRPGLYTGMMISGKLSSHLEETDRQVSAMMDRLTKELAQSRGVTEALKASDQMVWVRQMENIRSQAEETVLRDLIYS